MAILYPVLADMRDTTEVRKSLLSFDQEFRNVVLTIEGLIERVDSKTTFENLTVTNTLTVGVRVVAPILNAPTTLNLQTGGVTGLTMDASRRVGIGVTPTSSIFEAVENLSGKTTGHISHQIRTSNNLGVGTAVCLFVDGRKAGTGFAGTIMTGIDVRVRENADTIALFRSESFGTALTISGSGSTRIHGNVGFYNTAPIAKPNVTGSRGGNAALASLLTALANQGLITNSTT
jgi:hypothetical protein